MLRYKLQITHLALGGGIFCRWHKINQPRVQTKQNFRNHDGILDLYKML